MARKLFAGGVAATTCLLGVTALGQATLAPPTYTAEQAQRGKLVFAEQCASCHGEHLDDGQFAAALRGPAFEAHWGAGGLDGPFAVMTTQMPPSSPGALPIATYADLLAFILRENGVAASDKELSGDPEVLRTLAAPSAR